MKMIKNFTLTLALAVTLGLSAQEVAVTNGGFESAWGDEWAMESNGGSVVEFSTLAAAESASSAHSGAEALVVFVDGLGVNDWDQQIFNRTWAVEKGKTYTLSIWVKDVSQEMMYEITDTAVVSFACGHATTYVEYSREHYHTVGSEWEQLQIEMTAALSTGELDENDVEYKTSMSMHFVGIGALIIDDFEVREGTIASIGDNKVEALDIYPNPVNDYMIVGAANAISVDVYSLTGAKVVSMSGQNLTRINTSDLQSGVYMVSVTDAEGKKYASKIMKK